ncbi:MAG: GNAT family N-acetyltransferase [Gammaproteobacteria bacterium]|nr:GNAT family N-acetyltransferase [Gammaproteobacteria bacterium]
MQSEQFEISPSYFQQESITLDKVSCSPFYHSKFFRALETSGSVSAQTGWHPQHLKLFNDSSSTLIPGYAKSHSYGEYIFDWNIADAVTRAGIQYYPKWVSQFPFSPVEAPNTQLLDSTSAQQAFKSALADYFEPRFLTAQLLYQPEKLVHQLEQLGGLTRKNIGFKWENTGYQCFDDFLVCLKPKSAKNIRQERRKVANQNLNVKVYHDTSITSEVIERFYPFYRLTYQKRSGTNGYINLMAFDQWLMEISNQTYLVFAQDNGQDVASALFVADKDTLYGRYWGSRLSERLLHFELCYYRGIEICIENKLKFFNPGVQGEHKVRRGFAPYWTYSSYFYFDPILRGQIHNYFKEETEQLEHYRAALTEKLPFR